MRQPPDGLLRTQGDEAGERTYLNAVIGIEVLEISDEGATFAISQTRETPIRGGHSRGPVPRRPVRKPNAGPANSSKTNPDADTRRWDTRR